MSDTQTDKKTTKPRRRTPAKKSKPQIEIQPMDIKEFRAKLEGIEMFQGDEWHPNTEQWHLIRRMIDAIVVPETPNTLVHQQRPMSYEQPTQAAVRASVDSSALATNQQPTPQAIPASTSLATVATGKDDGGAYQSEFV